MFKKFIPLFLIVALIAVSCDDDDNNNPLTPQEVIHSLYVVNSLGQTISLIDLEADTVYNDIYTTGQYPAEIEFHDGNLYIVNSGDNTLQIIDVYAGDETIIELGDDRNPVFMEFIDASTVAVSNWVYGTVSFVNLAADSVETEIAVGAGPWGMTYHDGELIMGFSNYDPVTWTYGQGRVAIIDAASRTLIDSVDVGTNPGMLFVDHQGEVNVVCIGDYFSSFGEVWRINPQDHSVIGNFAIGKSPAQEALAEDGTVYLAAGGLLDANWQPIEGYVLSYDSEGETPICDGSNPITITDATSVLGIAVDSDGTIYISCFNTNQVLAIDENGNILATYDVGYGPERLIYVETPVY